MYTTLHCIVRSDASYTTCKQTSIHACLHSTRRIDAHTTRDISFFMIHPQHSLSGLSGQHIHYVHIIYQLFLHSSNPLTGRTGRLHICQTLVPSCRAQVFT